jgi:uncharacterized RDD family membrane protein YckC
MTTVAAGLAESADTMVSGEAVHLEVRLARAGSRTLALMIDIVTQFILGIALFWLLIMVFRLLQPLGLPFDAAAGQATMIITIALVTVGYPTLMLGLTRGRSLGKLAMGLRVVRDDGGPITVRHAFTRALVGAALEWPGVLLPVSWLVSLGALMASPQAKRLADLAAGTLVIHERSPQSWGWVPATPPMLTAWAATLDLTDLSDQLALAARHFLARSRGLRDPYRTRLGEALSTEIRACTTPPPPPNTPGWAYLAAIVGERHRRAAYRLARSRAAHASLWPGLFPVMTPQARPLAQIRPPTPVHLPTQRGPEAQQPSGTTPAAVPAPPPSGLRPGTPFN